MRLDEVTVWVDGFTLSMFAKFERRHRVMLIFIAKATLEFFFVLSSHPAMF